MTLEKAIGVLVCFLITNALGRMKLEVSKLEKI